MADPQEYQRRLQNLLDKANAGNADAQYALALITAKQNAEVSLQWMKKAVAGGHPGASYTLGVWHIQGLLVAKDQEKGRKLLEQTAAMNYPDADLMLAVLDVNGIGAPKSWKSAVTRLLKAAKNGHPRALCQLAMMCRMSDEKAVRVEGERFLEAAAGGLDMLAVFDYAKKVLTNTKAGPLADKARAYMALAATKGRHPCALAYPGVQGFAPPAEIAPMAFDPAGFDWDLTAKFLENPPIPKRAQAELLKDSPHIEAFQGFFTEEEADYLIGMAGRNLNRSNVVSPISGELIEDEYRTSSDMRFWPAYQDLVIYCFLERIARATGEPVQNQEMLGVLKYEPGQEYKPHGDFFTPDFSGNNKEVERSGQRIKTFLVYLNEEFTGGETEFVNIDFKTRGKKGDGLMFINVTENNDPNTLTVHAGRPVEAGLKWLATMWIREKEYKPEPKSG